LGTSVGDVLYVCQVESDEKKEKNAHKLSVK
jgi:hypothetical protein